MSAHVRTCLQISGAMPGASLELPGAVRPSEISAKTCCTMRTHEGIKKEGFTPSEIHFYWSFPCCFVVGSLVFPCWFFGVLVLVSWCFGVGKMLFLCWSLPQNSISRKWQDTHLYDKRILLGRGPKTLKRPPALRIRAGDKFKHRVPVHIQIENNCFFEVLEAVKLAFFIVCIRA